MVIVGEPAATGVDGFCGFSAGVEGVDGFDGAAGALANNEFLNFQSSILWASDGRVPAFGFFNCHAKPAFLASAAVAYAG